MAKSVIDVKILGDNKGLSKALGESERGISKFARNVGKVGLAVGAAGAAAAAGLFKVGDEFDKAFDQIKIGTGATGEALEGLQDDFKEIAKRTPSGFADIGAAVASINTNLGLTGDGLQDFSVQVLDASRLLGEDATANADALGRAFNQWQVPAENVTAVTDTLFVATQKYGVGLGALTDQLNTYGPVLQNAGYSMEESTAIFGQLSQGGIQVSRVMPGLNKAFRTWADEGKNSREEFGKVVDQIKNTKDSQEALTIATAAFGAEGAQRMTTAIRSGVLSLDDLEGALGDTGGAIADTTKETDSWRESFQRFKNRVLVALEPLATRVFEAVGAAMEKVGPYVEQFIEWFSENAPKAIDALKKAWKRYGQPVVDTIIEAFTAVVEWVQNNWDTISEVAETVFNALRDAVQTVVDVFETAWPIVQDAIATTFDWIKNNKDVVIGALVGIGVGVATILVPAFIGWAAAATAAAAATIAAAAPFIAIGVALAAIGAALVWAYQNVEWFRQAVDTVVAFFVETVWPILQQTAEVVVTVVGAIVDFIRDNWDTIQTIIVTVFEYVRDFVADVWSAISDIIEAAMEIIQGVIDVVMGVISGDWGRVWDGIKGIVTGVWDAIKGVVDLAMAYVGNVIQIGIDAVKLAWETVWGGVSTFISDTWTDITGFVETGISDVVGFVTGLPQSIIDAVTGAFDVIWDQFKGVLNSIINAWNNLGFTLPEVSIDWNGPFPGGKVTVGGWEISTPDLPTFHRGGIVPGPVGSEMLALLEAGERIVPRHEVDSTADRPIVLVIEGRPFSAMLAEHESEQVAQLMAGVR